MTELGKIQPLVAIGVKEGIARKQFALLGISEPLGCKPLNVNIDITSQCCLKCRMCDAWKNKHVEELGIPAWIELVDELRDWLGAFRLSISGGEPFVKRGVWDLIDHCASVNLPAVVITNGFMLDEKKLERLAATRITQVVFSVDHLRPEVHDQVRGVPGSHARVMRAIQFLAGRGHPFVLATNTVITRYNIAEVGQIARGLAAAGAERILFQPVQGGFSQDQPSTFPFSTDLWPDSPEEVEKGMQDLMAAKQARVPIINTVGEIMHFAEYFREGPSWQRPWGCAAGYTTLHFDALGNLRMCSPSNAHVGNIQNAGPKAIWSSPPAEAERQRILACRQPCLLNCNRSLGLREKIEYGWNLVRRRS